MFACRYKLWYREFGLAVTEDMAMQAEKSVFPNVQSEGSGSNSNDEVDFEQENAARRAKRKYAFQHFHR